VKPVADFECLRNIFDDVDIRFNAAKRKMEAPPESGEATRRSTRSRTKGTRAVGGKGGDTRH